MILATLLTFSTFVLALFALGRAIVWVDERAYRASIRAARRRRALVLRNTKL